MLDKLISLIFQVFRLSLCSILALFVPGYIITYIFFKKISFIERSGLSLLLSICLVTLILINSNLLLRIPISFNNILFQLIFLCTFLSFILFFETGTHLFGLKYKRKKILLSVGLLFIAFLLDFGLFYYYYKSPDNFEKFYSTSMLVYRYYPEKNITQNLTNVKIQNPKVIIFDNKIAFLGYNIDNTKIKPGETFHIVYFWKGLNETDIDYTVFVHITDKDGMIAFQQDHYLPNPTSQWKKGDIIMEEYDVVVPSSIKTGKYYIRIGLYDELGTKERLPIIDERSFVVEYSKIIGEINIIP